MGFGGYREAGQKLSAELVVVAFVGLDDIAVEAGCVGVAFGLAVIDECLVMDFCEGFACELPGGDALDG